MIGCQYRLVGYMDKIYSTLINFISFAHWESVLHVNSCQEILAKSSRFKPAEEVSGGLEQAEFTISTSKTLKRIILK